MTAQDGEIRFTTSHEWAKIQGEYVLVGITEHAQQLLGDIVYIELPDLGKALAAGKEFGVIESVKAASDLYSPLSGEVIAINDLLTSTPELINQDAMNKGWIVKIRPTHLQEWDKLLKQSEYELTVK